MADIGQAPRHAFTTDAWTSMATEGYITTTCHYIDPRTMTLQERVLDTKRVTESHTAENLAAEMKSDAKIWNLKDPVAVTDNAANIMGACDKAEYPHFGCFAHTLNLAVNRALEVSEVSKLVGKCRKVVAFFKMSDQKTSQLKSAEATLELEQLKLIQDVVTRWNSALAMCRRILRVFPAIMSVLLDRKATHLILSGDEIKNLGELVNLLTPFETATVKVSSSKKPTAGLILPMIAQFKRRDLLRNEEDSNMVKKAKMAIRTDLDKRYTDEGQQRLLGLASFLDPRFKSLNWLSGDGKKQVMADLKQEALAIASKSASSSELPPGEESMVLDENPESTATTAEPAANVSAPAPSSDSFFDADIIGSDQAPVAVDLATKIDMEITRYSQEPSALEGDHPITWWRERMAGFKILPLLVERYLMIPATSVPSERVFSTAGAVVSKKRSCLHWDSVNMLIFLHENYPKYCTDSGSGGQGLS